LTENYSTHIMFETKFKYFTENYSSIEYVEVKPIIIAQQQIQ